MQTYRHMLSITVPLLRCLLEGWKEEQEEPGKVVYHTGKKALERKVIHSCFLCSQGYGPYDGRVPILGQGEMVRHVWRGSASCNGELGFCCCCFLCVSVRTCYRSLLYSAILHSQVDSLPSPVNSTCVDSFS